MVSCFETTARFVCQENFSRKLSGDIVSCFFSYVKLCFMLPNTHRQKEQKCLDLENHQIVLIDDNCTKVFFSDSFLYSCYNTILGTRDLQGRALLKMVSRMYIKIK